METSAKTAMNVNEIFMAIGRFSSQLTRACFTDSGAYQPLFSLMNNQEGNFLINQLIILFALFSYSIQPKLFWQNLADYLLMKLVVCCSLAAMLPQCRNSFNVFLIETAKKLPKNEPQGGAGAGGRTRVGVDLQEAAPQGRSGQCCGGGN